jgi:hypothetical protein
MIINVDLHMIKKLLFRYCVSVMYFRKNGKRLWQYISYLRLRNGCDSDRRDILCTILTPRKLIPLIKTCLNETYSKACTVNICLIHILFQMVLNKMFYCHSKNLGIDESTLKYMLKQDGRVWPRIT